ncbi:MAG: chemotaxis-specific protein-glutamate methyltransferase CheB [Gammaproteobacteria bacterium]|nr:chemotaxis-specific protein-glutamate methyltransferase CheB [Gammaproteobacteria bacterium]
MSEKKQLKVLVTDDSDVIALLLKAIIEAAGDMVVVGRARNGHEAVRMTHELRPDIITMDIRMPVMDGFDATRMIMSTVPTPIVVISAGIDDQELSTSFRSIDEGALAVIEKPAGDPGSPEFVRTCRSLVETLRAMAEVKLVRRRQPRSEPTAKILETKIEKGRSRYEVVGIVSSTGGPTALTQIFSQLPLSFPLPILVVQHISPGFCDGFASWMQGHTLLAVEMAKDQQQLRSGTIYIAPDNRHLEVRRQAEQLIVHLSSAPPVELFRPAGTRLLQSLAGCCGRSAIGAVLTGMGRDGADGLAALQESGGHTFVQDEKSSIINGMPAAARLASGTEHMVPLSEIAPYLVRLVSPG